MDPTRNRASRCWRTIRISHSVPSIWYMLHLKAPGLDVTGVSLPGLPLVILGHNEHIAWGATNTAPDVQDLYVETFNPRDSRKYLHNNQWVDAEVRDETIEVRGEHDYHLSVTVTRHGPIISRDGGRALALQWTLLLPHAVHLPFLSIDQASNWQQFTAALRNFAVPMQNFVYADDAATLASTRQDLFRFAGGVMARCPCREAPTLTIGPASFPLRSFRTPLTRPEASSPPPTGALFQTATRISLPQGGRLRSAPRGSSASPPGRGLHSGSYAADSNRYPEP